MLLSLIGYLFCLALGAWGFATTGQLLASGAIVATLDNLFLALFAALMGVTCFGYLAWRFYPALAAGGGAGAPAFALPEDPPYTDAHMPLFNKIWVGLLVLTAIEVVLAYVQIAGLLIMLAILLVLSLVKAGMIMATFMHLQFDNRLLALIVVLPALACILIMCGYFFPDSFRLVDLRP